MTKPSHTTPESSDFLRLFMTHQRRIFGYIVSLVPHLTDAEDLLQATSLVMWEKFDQFEPGTNFVAWGCRIAHFKVLHYYEQQHRAPLHFNEPMLAELADEVQQMQPMLDARHQALGDCLQKLTSRDRDLISRRYADGSSVSAMSAQVGRSIDAIYKALRRIREGLLQCVRGVLAGEGFK